MIKIVCIIPSACNHRTLPYLKKTIRLLKKSASDQIQLTIIVVSDNPNAQKLINRIYTDTIYLVSNNFGFAQSNNQAIEKSMKCYKSDYYLLINDDAWIDVNFFKNFCSQTILSADLVIPLVYGMNGTTIDSFGGEYYTSGYVRNATKKDWGTTMATAACLLIKTTFIKALLRHYGYIFNPILNYYMEDTELSIRAHGIGAHFLKSGQLKVFHKGSATSKKLSDFVLYQTYRNMIWVILLTWPIHIILKNLYVIMAIHFWIIITSFNVRFPLVYLKIFIETLWISRRIFIDRRKALSSYSHNFKFESIFSPYAFRTRKQNIPLSFSLHSR